MKIAIIGAPGSGKTALAQGIRQRDDSFEIVDDYVPVLEKEMDMAFGIFASYAGNLAVALKRMGMERVLKERNSITCGTHVETMIYIALDGMLKQEFVPEGDYRTAALDRTETAMRFCAMLMQDSAPYDVFFYVPLTVAAADITDKRVDENIPPAIELYGLPVVKLEGTAEECIDQAMAEIQRAQEEQAEEDNAPASS